MAIGEANIDIRGGVKAKLQNDNLSVDGMKKLWVGAFMEAESVMLERAAFCCFTAQGPLMIGIAEALSEAGLEFRHQWVWVKPHLPMTRCDRHYRHEPILYGWRKGGSHDWYGDRKLTSVLEHGRDSRGHGHPTVKPTSLLLDLMYPLTQAGGAVLDPFAGSGSILLACERSGRDALACEIDPKFATLAVNRWQEETGKEAVRIK